MLLYDHSHLTVYKIQFTHFPSWHKREKWALNTKLLRVWVRYYLTQAFMKHNLFNYPAAFNYPMQTKHIVILTILCLGWIPLYLSVHVGYWSCSFSFILPQNSCQTDCAETHYISRVWLSCFQWITVPQNLFSFNPL